MHANQSNHFKFKIFCNNNSKDTLVISLSYLCEFRNHINRNPHLQTWLYSWKLLGHVWYYVTSHSIRDYPGARTKPAVQHLILTWVQVPATSLVIQLLANMPGKAVLLQTHWWSGKSSWLLPSAGLSSVLTAIMGSEISGWKVSLSLCKYVFQINKSLKSSEDKN